MTYDISPGEENGNPLQYSCLESPMDRRAWWATVHGVTKSRTRLSDFTSLHLRYFSFSVHSFLLILASGGDEQGTHVICSLIQVEASYSFLRPTTLGLEGLRPTMTSKMSNIQLLEKRDYIFG